MRFDSRIIESAEYVLKHKPVRKPGEELYVHPTYTIPEAAEYLAIDSWTLHSWYAEEILKPSGWYGNGTFALLSFRDVEEAYKIHLLRTKFKYSMQELRKALPKARHKSGSEHPLITHNFVAFKELCIEIPTGRKKSDRRVESLGPIEKPLLIPEVTDVWGKRIVNRGKGRIQIFPWRFAEQDEISRPVSLDPEVMSGRLVVTGTRIPVVVLRNRQSKGESPLSIANDYGIDRDIVQKALEHIGKAA